ncbi:phosphotransferase enzyme family protein [Streptoalloteichus hindustanus]|nr:phosphotransferase [Streptoalloteichus hindustanus]
MRAWELPAARVVEELTDLGDRARVWRVRSGDRDYVAKLTFDAPRFVEPGLRIAATLDRAGIVTGAPVPTRAGGLCRRVGWWRGGWTLAVLEHVAGHPLDWSAPEAPEVCGDLLGQVHHILTSTDEPVEPAGRLLDFYAEEATRVGGQHGDALAEAVAAVRAFDRRVGLTQGVLYGDPAPEVLRVAGGDALALIDWGTPSWGPVLHDVVSWQLFAQRHRPTDPTAGPRLLAAYRARMPVADAELAGLELVVVLHRAIQAAWEPTRAGDDAR